MNYRTLLAADVDAANELRANDCPLPWRLWCAWISQFCVTKTGTGGYDLSTQSDSRLLCYQRPKVLASHGGPWFREMGSELMRQAILLLEDDADRECALRSAGFLAPGEVDEGIVDIASVNRRLEAMGIKHIGEVGWSPAQRQASSAPREPRLRIVEEEPRNRLDSGVDVFLGGAV